MRTSIFWAKKSWLQAISYSIKIKDGDERVDLGALQYTVLMGNADDENGVDVADIFYFAFYLFKSGSSPCDFESIDLDCDGEVELLDLMYLINYIFRNIPFPCQKIFTS